MLMIPDRGSLCEGHCLLVPVRHVSAVTELDEDEYDELKVALMAQPSGSPRSGRGSSVRPTHRVCAQMFERCLVEMFKASKQDVIFFETATALRKNQHTVVHCVPLALDDGGMAPMFFKARRTWGGGEGRS
jgi:hypothetical protein